MSHVLLVRHAQASFLEPDYDRLSPLGEMQALRLGKYWARQKAVFDLVWSGPCRRQMDTARIVGEVCRKAGLGFPAPVVAPEFDEYRGEAVLEHGLPRAVESDPEICKLQQAFLGSASPESRARSFQKLFEALTTKWVDGALPLAGVESWSEFCARVNRGLSRFITEAGRGARGAIFCSGGPIGVAVQRALGLSPQNTLRVAWMSRNSSYSEFLFSGERFTLSAFNAFPHLEDPDLLTYR